MKPQTTELPKPPFPHIPHPAEPGRQPVQQPTVYVYEKSRWEYRIVRKSFAETASSAESDLNALGAEGWELVGVVGNLDDVTLYFKRLR